MCLTLGLCDYRNNIYIPEKMEIFLTAELHKTIELNLFIVPADNYFVESLN
jgi:hypothetical protein